MLFSFHSSFGFSFLCLFLIQNLFSSFISGNWWKIYMCVRVLLLISSFIVLWSVNMAYAISFLWNLLWAVNIACIISVSVNFEVSDIWKCLYFTLMLNLQFGHRILIQIIPPFHDNFCLFKFVVAYKNSKADVITFEWLYFVFFV